MTRYWTFKDYVDGGGNNEVLKWLNSLPKRAKVKINAAISRLEVMERLEMPYVRVLKGPCNGLLELRILSDNVQYRPLCCYGPGQKEVTLLFGTIEKGGKFVPPSACSSAAARKIDINQQEHTCDHDFS